MLRDPVSAIVFLASSLLMMTPTASAAAAEIQVVDPQLQVSPDSPLSYSDLALRFAPGLAATPVDAKALAGIRHLGGADQADIPADSAISGVARLDIVCDGKPAMLVLYDYGPARSAAQSVSLLALYDMSAEPRLLDILDVGLDRETFFIEPQPFVAVTKEVGVLLVRNSHHNAGEEFVQSTILAVRGRKFHEVDTIGSMSWDTGIARIRTSLSFAAVEGAGEIEVVADVDVQGCDDGCDESEQRKLPKPERLKVNYTWNDAEKTFVTSSKAFEKLPFPDMEE